MYKYLEKIKKNVNFFVKNRGFLKKMVFFSRKSASRWEKDAKKREILPLAFWFLENNSRLFAV